MVLSSLRRKRSFDPSIAHTNAGRAMVKPLFRWYLRGGSMTLEGVLTVKLLLIVGAALTLAVGVGRRC